MDKLIEAESLSLAQQLQKIANLHEQGILSESEFNDAKKQILSGEREKINKTEEEIFEPENRKQKSNKKNIIYISVALVIMIGALLLIGIEKKPSSNETLGLASLIDVFMTRDAEHPEWSMGADTKVEPIKWLSQGVEGEGKCGNYIACRKGQVRVTIDGKEIQHLRERLEPIFWDVIISSSSDQKFGPENVEITPKCDTVECSFSIENELTKNGFDLHKLCQAGSSAMSSIGYLAKRANKSIYILFLQSTGSGGTGNWLTLSWSKPINDSDLCAEAKQYETEIINKPIVQENSNAARQENMSSLPLPTINVGDRFVYETESVDPNGKTTVSESVREVLSIDGNRVAVSLKNSKSGKSRTLVYDRSWNILETGDSVSVGMTYSPAIKYFDFPLYTGKNWKETSVELDKKSLKTRTHIVSGEVYEWGEIVVGAGKFNAIKIVVNSEVIDGEKHSSGVDVSWYAPAIGRTIRSELSGEDIEGRQYKKLVTLSSVSLVERKGDGLINNSSSQFETDQTPSLIGQEAKRMGLKVPSGKQDFLRSYAKQGGVCDQSSQSLEVMKAVAPVSSECAIPSPCNSAVDAEAFCNLVRVGFDSEGKTNYFQITLVVKQNSEYINKFENMYGRSNRKIKEGPNALVIENSAFVRGVDISYTSLFMPKESPETTTLILMYAVRN